MTIWYKVKTSSTGLDAHCKPAEVDTLEEARQLIKGSPYASIHEFDDGVLVAEDFYYPTHPNGICGEFIAR
jgi:hypothetical protein